MKVVMFWSYKGGSGRTVAAANTAAALAKSGKKVAIIDLDFEGAGLHHVYTGATKTPQYMGGKGIQNYLKGEIPYSEIVIDVFGPGGPLRACGSLVRGKLLFVFASYKVVQVNLQDPNVLRHLEELIAKLEKEHDVDVIVIDAASGIGEVYNLAATVSDEIMVLLRWSQQHVEGTLNMIRLMGLLKEFGQLGDQRYIPMKVVASAVPVDAELDRLTDKPLRQQLLDDRSKARSDIKSELEKFRILPSDVFHQIPEMLEMKWTETIAVFGDTESPYESLARKLMEADAETPKNTAERK